MSDGRSNALAGSGSGWVDDQVWWAGMGLSGQVPSRREAVFDEISW
jgi:hypothetical protein